MFNKLQKSIRLSGLAVLVAAVGLLAVCTSPVFAVPQIMSTYGDQMAWSSAEINAMGGTGTAIYRGALSNIFNPALLTDETGYRLDAGMMLDQEHEDRFQPLFDSFDSWVVDAAIASNRSHYWQTGFGAAGRFFKDSFPVVLSVALADRYPFSYTFEEELRNPSPFPPGQGEPARDLLIEERMREVTGTLRDLSFGMGAGVHEKISVGAAVHYAFGTRKELNTVRDMDNIAPDDSYSTMDEFELSGVNFTLGARGVINERLEVGVAWESQLTATGDRVLTMLDDTGSVVETHEGSIKYPNMFRAGLTFRPRTDPRTTFTVELEYKPWSELVDAEFPGDDNPQNLNDVTDVRVGLEHMFYNGIPLRFGFRHFDSYADRDASASVFSAGVGAPIGGGMLSASLELSKLSSVQAHQFPYPADYFGDNFRTDPFARVDDTRFRIGLGYKLEF